MAVKGVTKVECGLNVSPPCDGLPGDEFFNREGEDKFPSLDVSGVAAGKGGTSGERGLHVSPNCDGLPGNELSHREGEDFQPLDVSGVWQQKVVLLENVASM
jgi:hypothetical protein